MKKIIAVSLAGVLVSRKPWKIAHEIGMREHFENLGLSEEDFDGDYFDVVEKSIEKSWPDLSAEERIAKRRQIYFDRVLDLLKKSLDEEENAVVNFFRELKEKCKLVLVTTNGDEVAREVLKLIGSEDLFEHVFASASKKGEKDDKRIVFERMMEKIGHVDFLVEASGRMEEFCRMRDVEYVSFNINKDGLDVLEVLKK